MQKAATPVEGLKATLPDAKEALRHARPNAVVLERSGVEQGDIELRRGHALQTLVQQLGASDQIEKEDAPALPTPASQPRLNSVLETATAARKQLILALAGNLLLPSDRQSLIQVASFMGNFFTPLGDTVKGSKFDNLKGKLAHWDKV